MSYESPMSSPPRSPTYLDGGPLENSAHARQRQLHEGRAENPEDENVRVGAGCGD